jgi:hypothetical protein
MTAPASQPPDPIWPMLTSPIGDREPATALHWWNKFINPVNNAVEGLDDVGWTDLTLEPAWVNHGLGWPVPGYRRLRGITYLRGVIDASGGGSPTGLIAGIDDPGTGPGQKSVFQVFCNNGTARISIDVFGQPTLTAYRMGGDGQFVSLGGIRWVAANYEYTA